MKKVAMVLMVMMVLAGGIQATKGTVKVIALGHTSIGVVSPNIDPPSA